MTTITLMSRDNVEIVVDRTVAFMSEVLNDLAEDLGDDPESLHEVVPIANVDGDVLHKVFEWCEHHVSDSPVAADPADPHPLVAVGKWDEAFFDLKHEVLLEIILAANYLAIKPLLDAGCKMVANLLRGKTTEQMREEFGIVNDFTLDEEEKIREENKWAEDR